MKAEENIWDWLLAGTCEDRWTDKSQHLMWIVCHAQSARMSKITNDWLNPVWHRMLYSQLYLLWQQWAS